MMHRLEHDSLPQVDEAAIALPEDPDRRAAVLRHEAELVGQEWNRWRAREAAVRHERAADRPHSLASPAAEER